MEFSISLKSLLIFIVTPKRLQQFHFLIYYGHDDFSYTSAATENFTYKVSELESGIVNNFK